VSCFHGRDRLRLTGINLMYIDVRYVVFKSCMIFIRFIFQYVAANGWHPQALCLVGHAKALSPHLVTSEFRKKKKLTK
jgi:hypothetical protein